jgi:Na+-driven multidrug efflux pump
MRIEFVAMTVILALATVVGPFVGQNLGAGRFDRVRTCLKYSNGVSLGWGAGILCIFILSARWFAPLFNDNPAVVSAIVLYLMIVPACYGVQGILQLSATALNVLQKPLHAAALMAVQMFVLYIPLAYAGSRIFGMHGIFGGIVIAYFIGGTASHIVLGKILTAEQNSSMIQAGYRP